MRRALHRHPESYCDAPLRIDAEILALNAGVLALRYEVVGAVGDLRLPRAASTARADGLWRSTCFEAFLRAGNGDAYCEFNFAPSTEWAAYRFSRYREGMRPLDVAAPRIETMAAGDRFELRATLDLSARPERSDAQWRLGLAAVIEETNGRLSYWALAHQQGKPDFHHPDCFALELPHA